VVYWRAEEYAEILGEQLAGVRLTTWPDIRSALAGTWPMAPPAFRWWRWWWRGWPERRRPMLPASGWWWPSCW